MSSTAITAFTQKALAAAIQGKAVRWTSQDIDLARANGIEDLGASFQSFQALFSGVGRGHQGAPVGRSMAAFKAGLTAKSSDDLAVIFGRRLSHVLKNGTQQARAFARFMLAGGVKEGLQSWIDTGNCPFRTE